MTEFINHESIQIQAQRDANDLLRGNTVHNPYQPGSTKHALYDQHFAQAIYAKTVQRETEMMTL